MLSGCVKQAVKTDIRMKISSDVYTYNNAVSFTKQ